MSCRNRSPNAISRRPGQRSRARSSASANCGAIGRVAGALRHPRFDHRQPAGFGLRMQDVATDALHRNAVVAFGERGDQTHHVDVVARRSVCSVHAASLPPLHDNRHRQTPDALVTSRSCQPLPASRRRRCLRIALGDRGDRDEVDLQIVLFAAHGRGGIGRAERGIDPSGSSWVARQRWNNPSSRSAACSSAARPSAPCERNAKSPAARSAPESGSSGNSEWPWSRPHLHRAA
jgi:hypothetical protein